MKPRFPTAFGLWLRGARHKLGLTRDVLAAEAGVAPSTLRNIEAHRHRLRPFTVELILGAIGKRDADLARSAPSLLDGSQPPPEGASPPPNSPEPPAPPPPIAHVRIHPFGPRALLEVELDPYAVRQLVRARGNLLSRPEESPCTELPGLHLMLIEKK